MTLVEENAQVSEKDFSFLGAWQPLCLVFYQKKRGSESERSKEGVVGVCALREGPVLLAGKERTKAQREN